MHLFKAYLTNKHGNVLKHFHVQAETVYHALQLANGEGYKLGLNFAPEKSKVIKSKI